MANVATSDIPEDVVVAILTISDVLEILTVRVSCKRYYEITKLRVVWLHALNRIRILHPHLFPHLDQSASFYTSEELENAISKRFRLRQAWKNSKDVGRCRDIPLPVPSRHTWTGILPYGGRWLFILPPNHFEIRCLDLDSPSNTTPQWETLIGREGPWAGTRLEGLIYLPQPGGGYALLATVRSPQGGPGLVVIIRPSMQAFFWDIRADGPDQANIRLTAEHQWTLELGHSRYWFGNSLDIDRRIFAQALDDHIAFYTWDGPRVTLRALLPLAADRDDLIGIQLTPANQVVVVYPWPIGSEIYNIPDLPAEHSPNPVPIRIPATPIHRIQLWAQNPKYGSIEYTPSAFGHPFIPHWGRDGLQAVLPSTGELRTISPHADWVTPGDRRIPPNSMLVGAYRGVFFHGDRTSDASLVTYEPRLVDGKLEWTVVANPVAFKGLRRLGKGVMIRNVDEHSGRFVSSTWSEAGGPNKSDDGSQRFVTIMELV